MKTQFHSSMKGNLTSGLTGFNGRSYNFKHGIFSATHRFTQISDLYESCFKEGVNIPDTPLIYNGLKMDDVERLVGPLKERQDAMLSAIIHGCFTRPLFDFLASRFVPFTPDDKLVVNNLIDNLDYRKFQILVHDDYKALSKIKKGIYSRLINSHRMPICPIFNLEDLDLPDDWSIQGDLLDENRKDGYVPETISYQEIIHAVDDVDGKFSNMLTSIRDSYTMSGVSESFVANILKAAMTRSSYKGTMGEYNKLIGAVKTATIACLRLDDSNKAQSVINDYIAALGALNEWFYTKSPFQVIHTLMGEKIKSVVDSIVDKATTMSDTSAIGMLISILKQQGSGSLDVAIADMERGLNQQIIGIQKLMSEVDDMMYDPVYDMTSYLNDKSTPIRTSIITSGTLRLIDNLSNVKSTKAIKYSSNEMMATMVTVDGARLKGDMGIVTSSKFADKLMPESHITGTAILSEINSSLENMKSEFTDGAIKFDNDTLLSYCADALLLRGTPPEYPKHLYVSDLFDWPRKDELHRIGGFSQTTIMLGNGIFRRKESADMVVFDFNDDSLNVQLIDHSPYAGSIVHDFFYYILGSGVASLNVPIKPAIQAHTSVIENINISKLINKLDEQVVWNVDLDLLTNIKSIDMNGNFGELNPREFRNKVFGFDPSIHALLNHSASLFTENVMTYVRTENADSIITLLSTGGRVKTKEQSYFLDFFFSRLNEYSNQMVKLFMVEYFVKYATNTKGAGKAKKNADLATNMSAVLADQSKIEEIE